MYAVGGSIRDGQPPPTWPPSTWISRRDPTMPRSTGSPLLPPLRMVEKPGTLFRKSAPSLAGSGCLGALGSVITVSGVSCIGAVTTIGWSVCTAGPSLASNGAGARHSAMAMIRVEQGRQDRQGVRSASGGGAATRARLEEAERDMGHSSNFRQGGTRRLQPARTLGNGVQSCAESGGPRGAAARMSCTNGLRRPECNRRGSRRQRLQVGLPVAAGQHRCLMKQTAIAAECHRVWMRMFGVRRAWVFHLRHRLHARCLRDRPGTGRQGLRHDRRDDGQPDGHHRQPCLALPPAACADQTSPYGRPSASGSVSRRVPAGAVTRCRLCLM